MCPHYLIVIVSFAGHYPGESIPVPEEEFQDVAENATKEEGEKTEISKDEGIILIVAGAIMLVVLFADDFIGVGFLDDVMIPFAFGIFERGLSAFAQKNKGVKI